MEFVVAIAAEQLVFAAVTVEVVVSGFAIQIVVTLIGGQFFRAITVQLIRPVPTENIVVTALSEDNIVTFFAIQIVVAFGLRIEKSSVAENDIIARATIDFVVSRIAGNLIISCAAVDVVVAQRIDNIPVG